MALPSRPRARCWPAGGAKKGTPPDKKGMGISPSKPPNRGVDNICSAALQDPNAQGTQTPPSPKGGSEKGNPEKHMCYLLKRDFFSDLLVGSFFFGSPFWGDGAQRSCRKSRRCDKITKRRGYIYTYIHIIYIYIYIHIILTIHTNMCFKYYL